MDAAVELLCLEILVQPFAINIRMMSVIMVVRMMVMVNWRQMRMMIVIMIDQASISIL